MRLMGHFRNAVAALLRTELSLPQAATLVATAIFLRTSLENLTNANNAGLLNGFVDTVFHYPLWFLGVFLSIALVLATVGKTSVKSAVTLVSFGSFVICLPPLIDFFAYGFAAQPYNFLGGTPSELITHFLTLLWSTTAIGIGIKIEVLLALVAIFLFVLSETRSKRRALLASFLSFVAIYAFLALPVGGFLAYHAADPSPAPALSRESVRSFYFESEAADSLTAPRRTILDTSTVGSPEELAASDRFSVSMAILLLMTDILLAAALYARAAPERFRSALRNARYTRIAHYLLLAGFGVLLGISAGWQERVPFTLHDTLSLLSLVVALVAAWLFAVWENDETDTRIDALTNPERPLVRGGFPLSEWRALKWTFFTVALVAALLAGWYAFTFVLLFILLYHAYSCPPLRLKRFFLLSSLVIAANALLATLAGFYLVAGVKNLAAFPGPVALGILLVFFLAEHVKNLKDTAGDRAEGIATLTTLLGERRGAVVTGILAGAASVLAPFFFGDSVETIALGVFFAPILYLLVVARPFKEERVFFAYFFYALLFIMLTYAL